MRSSSPAPSFPYSSFCTCCQRQTWLCQALVRPMCKLSVRGKPSNEMIFWARTVTAAQLRHRIERAVRWRQGRLNLWQTSCFLSLFCLLGCVPWRGSAGCILRKQLDKRTKWIGERFFLSCISSVWTNVVIQPFACNVWYPWAYQFPAWLSTLVLAASTQRRRCWTIASAMSNPRSVFELCIGNATAARPVCCRCHTCHTLKTKQKRHQLQQRHNQGPSGKQVRLRCPFFCRFFSLVCHSLLLKKALFFVCCYFVHPTVTVACPLTHPALSCSRSFRICRMGQVPRRKTMKWKIEPRVFF